MPSVLIRPFRNQLCEVLLLCLQLGLKLSLDVPVPGVELTSVAVVATELAVHAFPVEVPSGASTQRVLVVECVPVWFWFFGLHLLQLLKGLLVHRPFFATVLVLAQKPDAVALILSLSGVISVS